METREKNKNARSQSKKIEEKNKCKTWTLCKDRGIMKAASIQTETRCSHQGGLVCQKKDCLSNIPRRGSGRKKKEIKKKNIVAAVLKGF